MFRSQGKVWHLPHETAHYYFFAPYTGPRWLTEGAAEFIAAHYNHQHGILALAEERSGAASSTKSCFRSGIENIRHLTVVIANDWISPIPAGCIYDMGENLLHQAAIIMGETAIGSAMGELHLTEPGRDLETREERIYEILLKHVPDDRREDFRELYRELHGGAAAFPATDSSDDHGDEATNATAVGVGQAISGNLDYMFDFDYFRFHAQEGQKYSMAINHEILRSTSIGLYGPRRAASEHGNWKSRELISTGPRIIWTAPSSDEYYFAVHNFGGQTGSYTLVITSVDRPGSDDYGDTPATAADISLGASVNGTISNDLDIDYFEFPVETGNRYHLEIVSGTLEEFRFRMRMPNGYRYRHTAGEYAGWAPPGFRWYLASSGQASLAIDGVEGNVGTYTLKVTRIDDGGD